MAFAERPSSGCQEAFGRLFPTARWPLTGPGRRLTRVLAEAFPRRISGFQGAPHEAKQVLITAVLRGKGDQSSGMGAAQGQTFGGVSFQVG
jgi:hypothetical protein